MCAFRCDDDWGGQCVLQTYRPCTCSLLRKQRICSFIDKKGESRKANARNTTMYTQAWAYIHSILFEACMHGFCGLGKPCADSTQHRNQDRYMAGAGVVLHLWNEWAVQILVLLSFSLQVFLFIFAGTRRRNNSTVLRVLLWLAYQLADSTATYTLGHLSIASSPHEHHLVAFWAPFLLLHLGGQDTITAYALEDNRLWLRHLQTFLVQVLGAAYVLYKYVSGSMMLVTSSILMLAIGAIKFGERIWALKCADTAGINRFLDKYCEETYTVDSANEAMATHNLERFGTDEEVVMHGGHILLGLCVRLFLDHLPRTSRYEDGTIAYLVEIYRVIEVELSLMYDILYTKARVIHTWYGLCIRVVSLVAIVATLVLFQLVNFKDGYNRVDVAISYILLVGAFLLEMASLFITIGSTWTCHFLYMGRWYRLLHVIIFLRRLVKAEDSWRSRSGTIRQFNMLDYCIGKMSVSSNLSKVNITLSPPVQISAHFKDMMLNEMLRIAERCDGVEERMNFLNKNSELPVFDAGFDSRIIIWHIATGIILCSIRDSGDHVKAIKTLSDYMMFLLAKHPEMLPGPSRPPVFAGALVWIRHIDGIVAASRVELAEKLLKAGHEPDNPFDLEKSPCKTGAELAITLLEKEWDTHHLLETIFGVWVEMLCYAGSHCSRDSHARKLSSGGEFVTVVWLLTRHFAEYKRYRNGDNRY